MNEQEEKKVKAAKGLRRMNAWMGLALFVIVASTAIVVRIYAATLSNRSDKLSNQAVSATANHTFSFNLSGGNTFTSAEKIQVDLPETAAFTAAGIWAATDFAYSDNVGARIIAGVNQGPGVTTVVCPDGANNVGVAVDTTSLIFTLLPCGPSFTTTSAGAFITFVISGTPGNGTLTNPSVAGSYNISMPDGAGDCQVIGEICSVAVSIIDSSAVTITATVVGTPPPPGGGGGGGGGSDTTAPIITNIHTQNPTGSSIQVCWDTNEAADSTVNFGPTNTYGSQQHDSGFQVTRCLTLSGLTEGATYHYQVCSKDPSNNSVCSGDLTFTLPDSNPPSISNVAVSNTSCNNVTITWTTNEASTSYVDFDLDGPPYANTQGIATLVTSHSVTVVGLTSGTTYHYRVRSGDAASNESFTVDTTFITQISCVADTTPPIITNIQVTQITSESARVCWDTNEVADALINYGTTNAYGLNQSSASFVTTRCFDLTGLLADTTYHYKLTSKDVATNAATTADLTFKTLVGVPGQCNVNCANTTINPYIVNPDGSVRKVGSSFVHVTNLSPGIDRYGFEDRGNDMDFNDVVIDVDHRDCSAVTFTAQPSDAAWHHVVRAEIFYNGVLRKDQVLWSDSHNAVGNNLTVNFSHDTNICNGTPPDITNVQAKNITETSATISWDTLGTMSNSKVEYGTQPAYGSTSNNASLVTNHVIVLTGLTKGTLYHYRVSSADSGSQSATSIDFVFTTLTDSTAPANVSALTATPGDSQVTLHWTNPTDSDFVGVKLLRKTNAYPANSSDGVLVYQGNGTTHLDLGVTNGVTYYYAVFAYDDVPNYSSGAVANATPSGDADVTAPGPVTNLTATPGNAQVQLNWTNPTALDFQGVKVLRKTTGYSANHNDGTLVYQGNQQSYLDLGVVNGTLYYYTLFAYDAVPNYSVPAQAQATPSATDVTPPGPVINLSAAPGNAAVQLTWTNPNTPDWTGTRIVRRTGQNPSGPNDGTVVVDGVADNALDSGLTNGTTYYYGAFAHDAVPNYASGAFANATPSGTLPPPAPSCTDSDGGLNYDDAGRATFNGGQTEDDVCSNNSTLVEQYCDANGDHRSETHDCGGGNMCSNGRCVPSNLPPTTEVCGNSICTENENSINCPADCPVVPQEPPVVVPPSDVDPSIKLYASDLRFYATAGKIQLRLQNGNVINFYNSSSFTVMIPDPSIRRTITSAFINFNGSGYRMAETASFEATVTTPDELGDYPLDAVVNYEDGSTDNVHLIVRLSLRPTVYEDGNGNSPIAGARVTLLHDIGGGNFGLWDGSTSSQSNPQMTDNLGRFGLILPVGSYKLVVEKEGYLTRTTLAFPVSTENILRKSVALIKLPPPDDIAAAIAFAAKVAAAAAAEAFTNDYVKQNAQDIAGPAATIATIANVAAAGIATATVIPYLLYLWSLLAHPFMLIARRRRKQWGVVYNSLSKLPLDLAIVRLLDAKTGRVVRSAVTDKDGRYFFIVQTGTYKMVAVKAAFIFPSDILRGLKEDEKYIDLYHGEVIEVKEETTITANIPLDPIEVEKTPRRLLLEGIGRRLQKSLGIITILAMAVATAITPTLTMFALLAANVVMYLVFRRLAVTRKPRNWGIVYDDKSKKPLPNVVTRIFDTRFNKLLETQVTDARGRYAFLVGQNTYYVTFDKPGYQKQQKGPVNLLETKKVGMHVVAVDVHLPRAEGAPPAAPHEAPPAPPTGGQTPPGTGGTPSTGSDRVSTSLPAMPPQPAGLALRTPVKPLEVAAPEPPAVAAAPVVPVAPPIPEAPKPAAGESYEAKMLARLKGVGTPAPTAAPAASAEGQSPGTVPGDGITVMPRPGEAIPKKPDGQSLVDKQKDSARETPQQLVNDIKNEASGAQNGTLLPDADQAHPEEKKPET